MASKKLFRSPRLLGAVSLVAVLALLFAVYQKERISTMLADGNQVEAEFERDYHLVPNKSDVKVAGVVVGTVTDVTPSDDGKAVVSMKVEGDTVDKLGSEPSAIVRPTTLLGGNYYVELRPGGSRGTYDAQRIPVDRTSVPVELDRILAALPKTVRDSVQRSSALTDDTLRSGARESLGRFLDEAPGALRPAEPVLSAVRGTRPEQDLWRLVPDLGAAAAAMTKGDGQQLGRIADSMRNVSAALSAQRAPLADTLSTLPQTLETTRRGLDDLDRTLEKLVETAPLAQPAVRQLDRVLQKTDPVLRRARPLVSELRPLLHDTLPVVDKLVPTAKRATGTLENVRGPVMDRINGPIATAVLSEWEGSGPYKGNGRNGHRLYEEVGYLAAHTANLSKYGNKNGRMLGLGLGVGVSSVGGNNIGTAKLLQSLGLLPGGGVQLLSPPDNAGDTYSPQDATAPGQEYVIPGLLGLPEQTRSGR